MTTIGLHWSEGVEVSAEHGSLLHIDLRTNGVAYVEKLNNGLGRRIDPANLIVRYTSRADTGTYFDRLKEMAKNTVLTISERAAVKWAVEALMSPLVCATQGYQPKPGPRPDPPSGGSGVQRPDSRTLSLRAGSCKEPNLGDVVARLDRVTVLLEQIAANTEVVLADKPDAAKDGVITHRPAGSQQS